MICRLYELYVDTNIDVGAKLDCDESCPDYCKDSENHCFICSDKEVSLSKGRKYGWTKIRTIEFKGVEILVDEETAYQIIKLIHPSLKNIWIIRWLSKNKNNLTEEIYTLHISGKEFRIEDLEKLNWFLRTRCGYDGRPLKLQDFTF